MKYTLEIIVAVVIIAFAAIFLVQNAAIQAELGDDEEAWGGADGSAADLIEEQGYEPWSNPVWEPPSGEIESLLFALQAAIGAFVIGYVFGLWRGAKNTSS
ncbi:energy-coupling factor ABC transporter substrate-binding protein [Methanocalculus taiwanensis]|uniref:Cobalt transport protein CbiN n=1 Tax=Methanocalculus taiwanensis TaxID=106207 RepID=A0ABD4TLQ9_9EURY|nr:energy-coupling factor ABC transporter substrate-binding protein [Methanocalculus taiwanensis]MCQ1539139.1 energy-coupling factor ABC transporter substrate-binding protein [Methanocalculus taiwanensis]